MSRSQPRSGELRLAGACPISGWGRPFADYVDLPLTRHDHLHLMARILTLRHNFSAYDATYVALSEELGATLATADARLRRAAARHGDIPLL